MHTMGPTRESPSSVPCLSSPTIPALIMHATADDNHSGREAALGGARQVVDELAAYRRADSGLYRRDARVATLVFVFMFRVL